MSSGESSSDADVIAASLRSPERFAELFDRHALAVHRYARRRVGSAVADDVMAETFLIAFDKRNRYDQNRPVARPWLLGIATTLLARHRRTESRRWQAYARAAACAPDGPDLDVDDLATRLDAQEAGPRLARLLADLHQRDRDVLLLYGFADLTYEQIAEALAVPIGTVRSRLNRARRRMRAGLEPVDGTDPPEHAIRPRTVPTGGTS